MTGSGTNRGRPPGISPSIFFVSLCAMVGSCSDGQFSPAGVDLCVADVKLGLVSVP
jgi:hypothetical protein